MGRPRTLGSVSCHAAISKSPAAFNCATCFCCKVKTIQKKVADSVHMLRRSIYYFYIVFVPAVVRSAETGVTERCRHLTAHRLGKIGVTCQASLLALPELCCSSTYNTDPLPCARLAVSCGNAARGLLSACEITSSARPVLIIATRTVFLPRPPKQRICVHFRNTYETHYRHRQAVQG